MLLIVAVSELLSLGLAGLKQLPQLTDVQERRREEESGRGKKEGRGSRTSGWADYGAAELQGAGSRRAALRDIPPNQIKRCGGGTDVSLLSIFFLLLPLTHSPFLCLTFFSFFSPRSKTGETMTECGETVSG